MISKIITKLKDNSLYLNYNNYRYRKILKKIKKKNKINIIFLTNHISQWKYQSLLNLFDKFAKYKTSIIFIPDDNYNNNYKSEYIFNKIEFKKKGIDLISSYDVQNNCWKNINKIFKPDIVFFSRSLFKSKKKYSIFDFVNSLNCYVPYSLFIDKNDKSQCATLFHKLLWRQFLPFEDNLRMAKNNYDANNIVITDYLGCDLFKLNKKSDKIWKNPKHKKVIWAPHHTIEFQNKKNYFSTFLNTFKDLIYLSDKYKHSIDFCFKPHPALKQKLYNHNDWGRVKTNDFYNFWKNSKNTILSESDYQNLFIESDALILDSISFAAEYLYLEKPYCFLIKDFFDYNSSLNLIGKKIFDIIEKSNNLTSLDNFLINSVLKKNQDQINVQKKLLNEINFKNKNHFLESENIFNFIEEKISN
jgi:hypothetical protein